MALFSSRQSPFTFSVPASTGWVSYTPTGSWGSTTYAGKWRRQGENIELQVDLALSGAPSGTLSFTPAQILNGLSLTVNASNLAGSSTAHSIGTFSVNDDGLSLAPGGQVKFDGTTIFLGYSTGATTAQLVNATNPITFAANDNVSLFVTLPITGWTSHTASATRADAVTIADIQTITGLKTFGAPVTMNAGAVISNSAGETLSLYKTGGAALLWSPDATGASNTYSIDNSSGTMRFYNHSGQVNGTLSQVGSWAWGANTGTSVTTHLINAYTNAFTYGNTSLTINNRNSFNAATIGMASNGSLNSVWYSSGTFPFSVMNTSFVDLLYVDTTGNLTLGLGNMLFATSKGIESSVASSTLNIASGTNTTTLNLGTGTGTQTVNIGTGAGVTTINLGGAGDTVNIAGTLTYVNTTNLQVTDKNVVLNFGGNDTTSEGAGITVDRAGTDGSIIYENALVSKWKLGALGSESEVITSAGTQTLAGAKSFSSLLTASAGLNVTGGNVGIGTASPSSPFHVNQPTVSSFTDLARFSCTNTGRTYSIGLGDASGGTDFHVRDNFAASTRLSISATGNVGIGTASPSYALQVNRVSPTDDNLVFFRSDTTGGAYVTWNRVGTSIFSQGFDSGSGTFKFRTGGVGSTGTEVVSITSAGAVTLGPSAGANHSVNGNLALTLTSTTGSGTLNNFGLGTDSIKRFTSGGTKTITGVSGGIDGRIAYVINTGGNLTFNNEDAGSTDSNRIITGSGAAVTITGDGGATLIYDGTTQRWRIVGIIS